MTKVSCSFYKCLHNKDGTCTKDELYISEYNFGDGMHYDDYAICFEHMHSEEKYEKEISTA